MSVGRFFAAAAVAACFIGTLAGETLGSVLTAHHIPLTNVPSADQAQPITSYAASRGGRFFLLAYYDYAGSEDLPSEMRVLRFDRRTGGITRAVLHGHGNKTADVSKQLPTICLSPTLDVSEDNGLIAIGTHITPSAVCTIILNSNLKFETALMGAVLARVHGQLIVEGNTIHFAPIHPETLAVYNPRLMQLAIVYPPAADSKRNAFSKLLREHLPAMSWCRTTNNPCDPERFTTDFTNVIVDPSKDAFSFDAVMSPEGFGPEAEAAIRRQTVRYQCSFRNGKWETTSK